MLLVTTADERTWSSSEPMLFLGEWCKPACKQHLWKNLSFTVLPYHWQDASKAHHEFKYLESVYEAALLECHKILNALHHTEYSLRYWRIIVGPWLKYFIDILYDRFSCLETLSETEKQNLRTIVLDLPHHPPLHVGEFFQASKTDIWNHTLFARLLKRLGFKNIILKPAEVETVRRSKPFSAGSRFVRDLISRCMAYGPQALTKYVFIESYMSPKAQLALELSLGQIPSFKGPYADIDGHDESDFESRGFSLHLKNNLFERVLSEFVSHDMPMAYVEHYASLKDKILKKFPKHTQVIYTANAYSHREDFKIWAAERTEQGAHLYVGQHGGNMGVSLYSQSEEHQIHISDKFYTWGWTRADRATKTVPLTPGKLLQQEVLEAHPSGSIFFITSELPRYFYCAYSAPYGPLAQDHVLDQVVFAQSLSEEAKGWMKIKTDRSSPEAWGLQNLFKEAGFEGYILDPTWTFKTCLKQARLCVVPHNATILLESIYAQVPTVLFWRPEFYLLRQSAKDIWVQLKEVGIYHESAHGAASFVNRIYKNPMSWWLSQEVQSVLHVFKNLYARTRVDWLQEWRDALRGNVGYHTSAHGVVKTSR